MPRIPTDHPAPDEEPSTITVTEDVIDDEIDDEIDDPDEPTDVDAPVIPLLRPPSAEVFDGGHSFDSRIDDGTDEP